MPVPDGPEPEAQRRRPENSCEEVNTIVVGDQVEQVADPFLSVENSGDSEVIPLRLRAALVLQREAPLLIVSPGQSPPRRFGVAKTGPECQYPA
jgi:hypothetical protein